MKETIDLLNQYFDKCAHCHSFLQGTCKYPWQQISDHFIFLFGEPEEEGKQVVEVKHLDSTRFKKDGCSEQPKGSEFLNRLRFKLSWKDLYTTDVNPRLFLAALRKFADKVDNEGFYGMMPNRPFYFGRVSQEAIGLCLSYLDFHYIRHGDNILQLIQDAFADYTRANGLFKIHPIEIAVSSIKKANVVKSGYYLKNTRGLDFDVRTGDVVVKQGSGLVKVPLSSTRYNLQSMMDVSLLDIDPVLPPELFKELYMEKLDSVVCQINDVISGMYQNEMDGIFSLLGYNDGRLSDEEIKEHIEIFIDIENVFRIEDFRLLAKRLLDLCQYEKVYNPGQPLTPFAQISLEDMKQMRALFFDDDPRINDEKRILFKVVSRFYYASVKDFLKIWKDCRQFYPYDSYLSKNEWADDMTNSLLKRADSYTHSRGTSPIGYFTNLVQAQQMLRACLYGALLLTQTRLDAFYSDRTNLYGNVYDTDIADLFEVELTRVRYFSSMPDFKFIRKDETEPDFVNVGTVPTDDFKMNVENILPWISGETEEERFGVGESFYTEESLSPENDASEEKPDKEPFEFPATLLPAKAYFDALKDADYLDSEYRWIKTNPNHYSYQAGWASRIIVGVFEGKIKHRDVGALLGFEHIGELANSKKETKNKEIETVFTNAKLKLRA